MIKKEEVTRIGQFNKPHGVKGELSFTFTNDVFDGSDCDFFICEMDGILVPFRIESYKVRSDVSALVKLKGVDSEQSAKKFTNTEVYFPNQYFPEIASSGVTTWHFFIGFKLVDITQGEIGVISDIDESTANILFIVEDGENEILIPAAEDWIVGVDGDRKILEVELPEGLTALI